VHRADTHLNFRLGLLDVLGVRVARQILMRLWIDRSAERLGIPRPTLEDLIAAIIKDSEKNKS
jgi:hypothetical protein